MPLLSEEHAHSLRRLLARIWDTGQTVILALLTVFVIRTFIALPFLVSGASMEPTFDNGNYLIIDELTYRFRQPLRGEVVVFRYPGETREYFIKRIIGLPGETLTIARNGITITQLNGEMLTLDERYLAEATKTFGDKTITLGPDEFFMMGDNRTNSFDSRNWGPLKRDGIVGLARLRVFPFSAAGVITAPSY